MMKRTQTLLTQLPYLTTGRRQALKELLSEVFCQERIDSDLLHTALGDMLDDAQKVDEDFRNLGLARSCSNAELGGF